MAAERPWNDRYSSATSKKFVQQFLQSEADGTVGAPSAVLKKVEGLIQSLDERVGQQLERLDAAVGDFPPRPVGGPGGSRAHL